MIVLSAIATVISMLVFLGICGWAWSTARQAANQESAMLPFALPDETPSPQASTHSHE